jgi:hypothetical protein
VGPLQWTVPRHLMVASLLAAVRQAAVMGTQVALKMTSRLSLTAVRAGSWA